MWDFAHKPEYEVRWRGKPLIGANMRRELFEALRTEDFRRFFENKEANKALAAEKAVRVREGRGWERGEQAVFRRVAQARIQA